MAANPTPALSFSSREGLVGWLRAHPYTLLMILLLLGLGLAFVTKPEHLSEWDHVYLRTAERMTQGLNIYSYTEGYLYPPGMAWLAIPFTWLPQPANRLAFFLVNAICLVCLCRWSWQLAGGQRLEGQRSVEHREHLICLVGVLVGLRYSIDALAHQQTDLVIAALLVGGSLSLNRQRVLLSATCFGLAAGFKCTALLWCVFFVLRGRWLATVWLVLVAVGINLLPDLTWPHEGNWWLLEWAQRYLLPMREASYQPGIWGSALIYNQSLAGLFNRFCCTDWVWAGDILDCVPAAQAWTPGQLKLVIGGVSAALLGGMMLLWWRSAGRPGQDTGERDVLLFSSVLLLMVLLSPMSSKPHFATLLLPGFVLARLAVQRRGLLLWLLLGGAIVASVFSTRDIVGKYFAQLALWHGSVTWSTLLLLAGVAWVVAWPTCCAREETCERVHSGPGVDSRYTANDASQCSPT